MLKKIDATHFKYYGTQYKVCKGWDYFIIDEKHLVVRQIYKNVLYLFDPYNWDLDSLKEILERVPDDYSTSIAE